MWIPSDRTFGIVVGLFAVFLMLLFFELLASALCLASFIGRQPSPPFERCN
jgi:hypothetical protein